MGLLGWTRRDIPDLSSKTALVTGANSGIGFEICRQRLNPFITALLDAVMPCLQFVEHGCEVIMVGRDDQLIKWAARDLEEEFPGARLHPKTCNLEDLKQVEALAQDILSSKLPINILVCNAGRYLDAPFATTESGFEQTLAANYFGHAELTLLLLDRICASGPGARIVNTSSPAEAFGAVDLSDIKGSRLGTSGMPAYGRSKAMQIMWNHELQRRLRLAGKDVDCFAVHPGMVATGLSNKVHLAYPAALLSYIAMLLIGQSPLQGAQSALYAATAPGLRGRGGLFIGPDYATNLSHSTVRWARNSAVYDYDARIKLYEETLRALTSALGHDLPSLPAAGRPLEAY